MQILQLCKIDDDRRVVLRKKTLEAIGAGKGSELVVYENDGKLTMTPARDVEDLMEG